MSKNGVIELKALTQKSEYGALCMRLMPLPTDTNQHGKVFGGWLMSQLDLAGCVAAAEITFGRVVTVSVESLKFVNPVNVGDLVSIYAKVAHIGTTSVQFNMTVTTQNIQDGNFTTQVGCQATYTFVHVDSRGNKTPIRK